MTDTDVSSVELIFIDNSFVWIEFKIKYFTKNCIFCSFNIYFNDYPQREREIQVLLHLIEVFQAVLVWDNQVVHKVSLICLLVLKFLFFAGGLEASLCSSQKLGLETILGHYLLAFLQDLPDYSSFISWAR